MENKAIYRADTDESLARVLGLYDTPAYVRRGLRLARARESVLQRCEGIRKEWLQRATIRLRVLRRQVAHWNDLRHFMASGADCQIIAQLDTLLVIDPPPHASRMRSNWGKRSQLSSLIDCIGRFNLRWADFLRDVDLSDVNSEVTAYNQYYLFEKECAMRSSRLAAIGYEPARFITQAELAQRYPPLPLPRLNLVRRRRADGAESSNRWRS